MNRDEATVEDPAGYAPARSRGSVTVPGVAIARRVALDRGVLGDWRYDKVTRAERGERADSADLRELAAMTYVVRNVIGAGGFIEARETRRGWRRRVVKLPRV